MVSLRDIDPYLDELTALRHDLHAHPEIGMEEHRTADLVARELERLGIEVHRGVGRTGVVGVLRVGNGEGAIGLRADMDALAMAEANDLPYRSTIPGMMHACGHDGHTTMLLGAARYLAETRRFNGTVNLIFQPGEEGAGGAEAMIADGLFERFPCDSVFGMHNRPGLDVGQYRITPGPAMAGGAFFTVTVEGRGAHGARPEDSIDPVPAVAQITLALQTIVSRNIPPEERAVVSITRLSGGDAFNVIPQTASLGGTIRCFSRALMEKIRERIEAVAAHTAEAYGARATVSFRPIFAPLINDKEQAALYADAAAELVGEGAVDRHGAAVMGSEDFSFMTERVPGAYIHVGAGAGRTLHHELYDFNDAVIPYGVALYASIVERKLAPEAF
ncbi:M20 aminoacylase family protein [Gluconacetobacter asukensis]|uniref:Amidohydrolase n=1 Tax=Gluconacetobacter asukensis TaxID=1017181 RepID=A0A7W4NZT8_9PROT|nr:M20 aminoacylase family protein [Gluconacetobacter asukensis]MBB2172391.1 amidohydrolase [Gluconacetobacter asukensis]